MTEKDDPSRVAFGGCGNGGRHSSLLSETGKRTDWSGTATGAGTAFPEVAAFAALEWQILDRLDRGVIALDTAGHVISANRDARRVLEAEDSLRLRSGHLEFGDPVLDKKLARLLAALSLGVIQPTGFVGRLNRGDGMRPLRALVTPISRRAVRSALAVLVFIFDTRCQRTISQRVLRELYGLTDAQASVAAHLFRGHSVEQTAQGLGLSTHTVRSHLKRIFHKCDVRSQGELMHLLSLGPHAVEFEF